MKTKPATQYQCDFCGKKNYAAGHMKRHELHCTKNPNRACRMCKLMERENNLKDLMAMLPNPILGQDVDYPEFRPLENTAEVNAAIEALKEKADCPACTLAAIRQKGIPVRATSYDYIDEQAEFWKEYNEMMNADDNPRNYY